MVSKLDIDCTVKTKNFVNNFKVNKIIVDKRRKDRVLNLV